MVWVSLRSYSYRKLNFIELYMAFGDYWWHKLSYCRVEELSENCACVCVQNGSLFMGREQWAMDDGYNSYSNQRRN